MRVIQDKNEKPFGHCDDCNGQMRIGGNSYRENKFYQMYPWSKPGAPQIPVTVTEPKPEPKPVQIAPAIPVTVTAKPPPVTVTKKPAFDALMFMSGGAK